MSQQVVTRFAPSPTGFLHIGGARTALFNWLYTRKRGGKIRLRIEDTDRERSTEAAISAILDGLKWLGLDWDDEVVYQFSRAARHREVAEELLARGAAYRCYASAKELDEMRETAKAEGRPPRYDGRWRDRSPDDAPPGVSPVIRLKAPREGETVIDDAVQGRVVFPNKDIDDFVLLRSDGAPTYMLAVVVDDHDMGVTQIIRGDDHLTNAARQKHIYEALGWETPAFAHIPLIHGPDGAKLSKRHGALGVDAYRAMGYLPAALRNYLARLGWSQGDKEFFTGDELIEAFDLAQVHRSPARFDFVKLENMNGHFMRAMDDAELLDALVATLPYLKGGMEIAEKLDEKKKAQLLAAMSGLKARAKTLNELLDGAQFLFAARPLAMEAKAAALLGANAEALAGAKVEAKAAALLGAKAEALAGAKVEAKAAALLGAKAEALAGAKVEAKAAALLGPKAKSLEGAEVGTEAEPLLGKVGSNNVVKSEAGSFSMQSGRAHLRLLKPRLEALPECEWKVANLEAAVRETAEALGVKLGDLAQPLRAALTGRATSPGIFEVMEILGRDESLGRLADQAGAQANL